MTLPGEGHPSELFAVHERSPFGRIVGSFPDSLVQFLWVTRLAGVRLEGGNLQVNRVRNIHDGIRLIGEQQENVEYFMRLQPFQFLFGKIQAVPGQGVNCIQGGIAHCPVVDTKAIVFDGKEHPVDSKPVAFEIAGREEFKLAVKDASPVLLEPIMNVRIVVPEANMGDVLGDLNTRRARVLGMDTEKGRSVVTATVPLAEMLRYTTDLRSITGGRGVFTMEFSNYEVVPAHLTQEIVNQRQKELAAQKEE